MWLGGIGDDVPNYRFIQLGCVLLYDRALTLGEIAILGRDPLAPFRLQTPVPMQVGTVAYSRFCVEQTQLYIPGMAAKETYIPGISEKEVYKPGLSKIEVEC
jgi:hypothetical protein